MPVASAPLSHLTVPLQVIERSRNHRINSGVEITDLPIKQRHDYHFSEIFTYFCDNNITTLCVLLTKIDAAMDNIQKQIGQNMKYFREQNDLSQNDISSYLNIDRSLVSKYEHGEREVPLPVLEKLANLYGVDISVFLESEPAHAALHQALAFRKDKMQSDDLPQLANFRQIVMNYIDIRKLAEHE
jgi:transcriptional regulator with XRE-family HTH domain